MKTFKREPNFSMRERQRIETNMAEEYCWAITGAGTVMLLLIRFQCVEFCISDCLEYDSFNCWPCVCPHCLSVDTMQRHCWVIRGECVVYCRPFLAMSHQPHTGHIRCSGIASFFWQSERVITFAFSNRNYAL